MSEDPSVGQTDQIEGQDIQKRLAISLVFNLGFEGAIHSCQANSWDGVLKWVIVLSVHRPAARESWNSCRGSRPLNRLLMGNPG